MQYLKLVTLLQIVTALFMLSLTSACTPANYDAIYSGTGSSEGDEARFLFSNIQNAD
jgi:hypothetical protein